MSDLQPYRETIPVAHIFNVNCDWYLAYYAHMSKKPFKTSFRSHTWVRNLSKQVSDHTTIICSHISTYMMPIHNRELNKKKHTYTALKKEKETEYTVETM